MDIKRFVNTIGTNFFVGVPDSQLKAFCDYLYYNYGTDEKHHIIAANEGNAVGIAAGYHLATGKVPVVYMQNSGEGNAINPIASLLNEKVYGIPIIFVIGWRGEPGVHDEPQHVFQGEITLDLLNVMDVAFFIIDAKTSYEDFLMEWEIFKRKLVAGKQVAFVIRKDGLIFSEKVEYKNDNALTREDAIKTMVEYTGDDPIICTTGKASRELFEIREQKGMSHENDFLNVGSMGHASSISLGISIHKPKKRVWCIDGDGAALMHMGAMAVIGSAHPENMVHIVINNGAHESVGGMPTVARVIDFVKLAETYGYDLCYEAKDIDSLNECLRKIVNNRKLSFLEIKTSIYSRGDLGRPTVSPMRNKEQFVERLR